jgi:hypothetical protein
LNKTGINLGQLKDLGFAAYLDAQNQDISYNSGLWQFKASPPPSNEKERQTLELK